MKILKIILCGAWGYDKKASILVGLLNLRYTNLKYECIKTPEKSGKFEVYYGSDLIHSKLKGDGFVDDEDKFDDIVDKIDSIE